MHRGASEGFVARSGPHSPASGASRPGPAPASPATSSALWLWLTTGMVTRGIGSPSIVSIMPSARPRTIRTARRFKGSTRSCSMAPGSLSPRGRGGGDAGALRRTATPNDGSSATSTHRQPTWHRSCMLVIDLVLFGPIGLTVWARADVVDPVLRRRSHQRHRPLLGLPPLRVPGRLHATSCPGAS